MTKQLTPAQKLKAKRWVWLLRRLMKPEQNERLDVLDAKLLADFTKATGAPTRRTLEEDLRAMYVQGLVERERCGLVYAYSLGLRAGAYIVQHGDSHE